MMREIWSAFVCVWILLRAILSLPWTGFRTGRARLLASLETERRRTGGIPQPRLGLLLPTGEIRPILHVQHVRIRSQGGEWVEPAVSKLGSTDTYVIGTGVEAIDVVAKGRLVVVQDQWQRPKQS